MNAKQMAPGELEQFFLDESAPGEKTRGGPPPLQSKTHPELEFCPQCGERIVSGGNYGLAYGGMGMYWVCEQDNCDWFYKIMDGREDE